MFALAFKGKVAQIEAATFPVHPALVWVDIGANPQGIAVGWSYDGSVFTAPPPPPPPIDFSELDNLDKAFKSFGLLLRQYANDLKTGSYTGSGPSGTKTVAEAKADFKAIYQALP